MANSDGIAFPIGKNGKRSTTRTGQKIFAAAARPVDIQLADAILKERKWRANYIQYVERLTVRALESAENALTIAQHGLDATYREMQFEIDGQSPDILTAMSQPKTQLHTATIHGTGTPAALSVPHQGSDLSGKALSTQLQAWLDNDHLEPDNKAAIEAAMAHPEWLATDCAYVLLGAGSEMGPLESLLAWGATVVAVDLNRPKIWRRLIKFARTSAGTLIIPVSTKLDESVDDETLAQHAGANIISQAPEIAAWLKTIDQPLTVGCYAYLDGGAHVRVSLAMDAIAQTVRDAKPDTSFAYLLTPTDVYGIPMAAADRSQVRGGKSRRMSLANRVSMRVVFRPNLRKKVTCNNNEYGLVNTAILQQGPNYTLAKRLQRWRAITAREAGTIVSCNVAPASYTRSVTKNRLFMIAYRGAGVFGLNAYKPETTKALMAAMLLYDLHHPDASAQPSTELGNPHELFMRGANHCGTWRMPYQLSSMLYPAVIRGAMPF